MYTSTFYLKYNMICRCLLKKNKSAKWHCGRHTLICKKKLVKKT